MSCTHIQNLISESLDRPLQPGEAERVRTHLAGCPDCAHYSRTLQAGISSMRTLPAVPASPRVRENVLAYVEAGRYGASRPRTVSEWLGQSAKMAGAMAAFVIVALVLVSLFNGRDAGDRSGRAGLGLGSATATTPAGVMAEVPLTPTPLAPTPVASPPVTLPPCQPGQAALSAEASLVTGYSNGPDFVMVTITALKSTGGIICQFTAPLSVAVLDANGLPVDAIGNPGRWNFDTPLPGEDAAISFAWTNWCGSTDGISVSANTDTGDLGADVRVSLDDIITPPCSMSDAPATLGALVPLDVAVVLPPCDLQQDATFNHYWEEHDGALRLWVGGTSMTACTPGDDVTITLIEANHAPLDIDGNPLSTREAASIGNVYYAGFIWSNWCGDSVVPALDIARPSMGAVGQIPLPACEDPNDPSRLQVITQTILPQSDPNITPQPAVTPPAAELPTCRVGEVALEPPVAELSPNGDTVSLNVAAAYIRETCALTTTLTVTLVSATGEFLPVEGNGSVIRLDGATAQQVEDTRFFWENWCGNEGEEHTVTFKIEGPIVHTTFDATPSCIDAAQPSTIRIERPD